MPADCSLAEQIGERGVMLGIEQSKAHQALSVSRERMSMTTS